MTKMEEDLAEMKAMLKSFFTKMEQRKDEEEQPIDVEKDRKGQRVYQKRLDRDTLSQICWQGEFANYQKMVFVSAANNTLEHLAIAYPKDKIKREVFGDLGETYKMHNEYSRSSTVTKSAHIVARMEDALQRLVYESEYNVHWTSADKWEKIPNEAVLHILRLEALPRSRAEVARLLDDVKFPQGAKEEATVVEKYRTAFPAYIMEYRNAYAYIMLAEDEETYGRMRSDPARSIPLRDASQKLSRETLPMPGLISRFTAKTPDDLWAAYYEHPMAFAFSNVKNSDDFVVVLDNVLQSWLSIRKEVDSSAYIHKDLLQRVRTFAPTITQERAAKIVNAIDAASIGANNCDVDAPSPSSTSQSPIDEREDKEVDSICLDNEEALNYSAPKCLVGIEVAQYVMDPTDMVGVDNVYGETLSQIIKDEGFADASINAAYQPVPTHGSSHRVAQRLTGPPMVNGRTTEATAKPRFVRICYEKMFKGRCDKQDCKYCHDEQVIKAFVKAHPERYADSPYHPSRLRG
mgnify:CR=1 FL=1